MPGVLECPSHEGCPGKPFTSVTVIQSNSNLISHFEKTKQKEFSFVLSKALHYVKQIEGLVMVNGKVCPEMKIMSSIYSCCSKRM